MTDKGWPQDLARDDTRVVFARAAPEQMAAVMLLEQAVFAQEQGIPAELVPIPEWRRPIWWCARIGETIIGAVAAWIDEGHWHWGRFAVEPRLRGRGLGRRLAVHSLIDLFQSIGTLPASATASGPDSEAEGTAGTGPVVGASAWPDGTAFLADPDTIVIEARDVTVILLNQLGAETVGPTRDFYGEPVTPIVLRRQRFLRHAK